MHAVHGAVQERLNQLLVGAAAQLRVQVQGLAVLLGDELFLDAGKRMCRQLPLGCLHRPQHPCPRHQVQAQVNAVFLLESIADQLHQEIVEVVAAQLGVAMAGQHLDDAFLDLDDGDVEGAAAQVIDEHAPPFGLVGVVGERGGGRFVEDADDLKAGQFARFVGGLALAVVEIGGHGDHGLGDRHFQLFLGPILERAQDHRRDFLRPIFLVAQLDLDVLAHLALDRLDGPLRRQHPLVTRRLANEQAAVLRQADERGQDWVVILGQDVRLPVAQDGHFAIGRSQIDAENRVHVFLPSVLF